MNILEKLIYALSGEMTRPELYGAFHLTAAFMVLATTVVLCITMKNSRERGFRTVLLVAWVLMVTFEIYKQLLFSFRYIDGVGVWDYQWYAFPFQLCSTPIYLLPIAIFGREGRVRDAVLSFVAFFAFFGGMVTFIYPGDVFTEYIGINIQTMLHHGLQVIIGALIAVHERRKLNLKYFFGGSVTFVLMCVSAFVMNVCAPLFTDETFNMFYIGPRFACPLAVLSSVYAALPYPLFLVVYVLGFTLAAFIFFALHKGANRIASRKDEKNA